ncbi:MAG: hypothetical protein LBS46_08630 [Dysgonamonadaceae bacterium]|jgi:hypothetical protein|nr:hypothetical protein [Dysgonamonadaceae bacterium]
MNTHHLSPELPADVTEITELLAKNTHKVWAQQRLAEGWKYGTKRNDEQKEHPCLVPYEDLPENEKQYDRNTALETVRFLLNRGYEIKYTKKPEQTCYIAANEEYIVIIDEGLENVSVPQGAFPVLWASNKRLPEKEPFCEIIDRCFLLLDADVLRKSGAMISSRVSWERTATELLWQIQNNPVLSYLHPAPHILIPFAEDGAVYIQRENGEPKAVLALAHGGSEGTLREIQNRIPDRSFLAMTAALAGQVAKVLDGKNSLQILPVLQAGNNTLTGDLLFNEWVNHSATMPDQTGTPEKVFEIPFTTGQNEIDPNFWCISNSVDNKQIFDLACDYVLEGAKIIEGLPQLSFGALTTIDRREIESYRNICNLIDNYVRSDPVRPLSIAVFGAPGSGKSFGVTQIAKNILPGKVEKLEFNVSQFTHNNDLGCAFQQVRDGILEGKLPLVFFDEFDSDRNGIQLGWIKNFLMPMQDGKFKDESGEHPLGKCILVFAGGTSATFEEFSRPMLSENADEQKTFKERKGPDFVSRLRGTINVLGPNPANENDKNYILRRALLLRNLCERKLKMKKDGNTPINKNVLWAMLLVPKYKHGARSMEAILDMSRIEGNIWDPVSLPFYSQLSLHVDADAFIRLVLREVILNSYKEKLAIAIHEDYRRKNPGTDYDIPWEELTEHIKNTNREQAQNIANYLTLIGCSYDSGDTPFPSVEQFTANEILTMGIEVHRVWMKSKIVDGWMYGKEKDAIQKTHPLLIAWEKLPEEEKQKDKDMAENIISLLKSIGLRVYKVM